MKLPVLGLYLVFMAAASAGAQTFGFDDQKAGEPPRGMTCALTGNGRPGIWKVVADPSAPSAPNVLAELDDDGTSYRFPLCVLDGQTAVDVDLSVRFKPVSGAGDQAAGLVWRYQDKDNYYVVRANALENNVVLYKVEKGKRTDLDPRGSGLFAYGKKARVPAATWSTLRVVVRRNLFEASLNGERLFDVVDSTFAGAGKVGVWTKADSVTHFDDLKLAVIKSPDEGCVRAGVLRASGLAAALVAAAPLASAQNDCRIGCPLSLKVEPTITFSNLFGGPRIRSPPHARERDDRMTSWAAKRSIAARPRRWRRIRAEGDSG